MLEEAETAIRARDLAGFHDCLEGAKVGAQFLRRCLANETRHGGGGRSTEHLVFELDADLRAALAWRLAELHRAPMGHVGAFERAPSDPLVLAFVGDLRLPFDRSPRRAPDTPMRAPLVDDAHRFEVR